MRRRASGVTLLMTTTMAVALWSAAAPEPLGGRAEAAQACWSGPESTQRWPPTCWRPYSDASPFNKRVRASPTLMSNSAAIMDRILGRTNSIPDPAKGLRPGNLHAHKAGLFGEPTFWPRSGITQHTFTISCGAFGKCSLDGKAIKVPRSATIEGGWRAPAFADRHMTVANWAAKSEIDLWQVNGPALPPNGGVLTVGNGGSASLTGRGLSAVMGSTGTAANTANLAGRLRIEELAGGYPSGAAPRIRHALAIVIDCHNGTIVWPARGNAPTGGRCSVRGRTKTDADAPPLGARLWLDMSQAKIDALPGPRWRKVLLRAMREYGMIFVDTGASTYFNIETESGNQYSAMGFNDRWQRFALKQIQTSGSDWSDYPEDNTYVGRMPGGMHNGIDWTASVWSRLRILAPCESTVAGCP